MFLTSSHDCLINRVTFNFQYFTLMKERQTTTSEWNKKLTLINNMARLIRTLSMVPFASAITRFFNNVLHSQTKYHFLVLPLLALLYFKNMKLGIVQICIWEIKCETSMPSFTQKRKNYFHAFKLLFMSLMIIHF